MITRFVWDGNTPLHEWQYDINDRPRLEVDESGLLVYDKSEPLSQDLITWIFDEGTFRPAAKLVGDKRYSIITDYLGTPVEAYADTGEKVWSCDLDIYGKVRKLAGESSFIPFRYQGQYEDVETGLYYNRFRYYSPDTGTYVSQDPLGLEGGMPNMYSYVHDLNSWIDPFGLLPIPKDVLKLLDDTLAKVNPTDANRGVYDFVDKKNLKYSGSAGTGKGTSPLRTRLMVHLRSGKLLPKNIKNLWIKAMDGIGITDQDVWNAESDKINETGGTKDKRNSNVREPPNCP